MYRRTFILLSIACFVIGKTFPMDLKAARNSAVSQDSEDSDSNMPNLSLLNLEQLQEEIIKVQQALKQSQARTATTTTEKPTTTTQRFVEKITPNRTSEDWKSLQREVEELQKQINFKLREHAFEPEKQNQRISDNRTIDDKFRSSDDDSESRNYDKQGYPLYGKDYGELEKRLAELKKEESKHLNQLPKIELEKPRESGDLWSGDKGGGIFEIILDVLKLFTSGDAKGLIGLIVKIPGIILKSILQGITGSLVKNGLKGLIARVLVPLIVLIGVNVLIVFMVYWLWDDSSCEKIDTAKPSYLPMNYAQQTY